MGTTSLPKVLRAIVAFAMFVSALCASLGAVFVVWNTIPMLRLDKEGMSFFFVPMFLAIATALGFAARWLFTASKEIIINLREGR